MQHVDERAISLKSHEKATKRILNFLTNPENEEMLNYLVCDFVNDGISYWAELDLSTQKYNGAKQSLVEIGRKNICFEDVLTQLLLAGEALPIVDREDEDGQAYYLTLGTLAYGVAMYREYQNDDTIDAIAELTDEELEEFFEDIDAADADLIVQYALFDDVIFG